MNAGIQGLAADLFKTALVRLDSALRHRAAWPAGSSSRSTTRSSSRRPRGEEDDVAALTESALTGAAELSVPLKVSMAWGDSWAAAKGG